MSTGARNPIQAAIDEAVILDPRPPAEFQRAIVDAACARTNVLRRDTDVHPSIQPPAPRPS